jgi:hypothetical protein
MVSHFSNGVRQGQWTPELVRSHGFSSAEECLANEEQLYQEEMDGLSDLTPEYAAKHKEFMQGVITGARESLRGM